MVLFSAIASSPEPMGWIWLSARRKDFQETIVLGRREREVLISKIK